MAPSCPSLGYVACALLPARARISACLLLLALVAPRVIKIEVPSLRERKEDVEDLSKYFLKNYSDSLDEDLRVISDEALNTLMKYDWPGNVRQLENVCYWLTLMSPSQNVKVQDLPTEVKEFEITDIPSSSWEDGMQNWLKNVSMNIESGLSEIAITKIEKMLIRIFGQCIHYLKILLM